jgi:hypothetical protein
MWSLRREETQYQCDQASALILAVQTDRTCGSGALSFLCRLFYLYVIPILSTFMASAAAVGKEVCQMKVTCSSFERLDILLPDQTDLSATQRKTHVC